MDNMFTEKNYSNKSALSFSKKKTPKKAEKIVRGNGDTTIEYLSVKRDRCSLNDQLLSDEDKKFIFTRDMTNSRGAGGSLANLDLDREMQELQNIDRQDSDKKENTSEDQIFSTRNLDLKFFSRKTTPEKQDKKLGGSISVNKSMSQSVKKTQGVNGQSAIVAPSSPNNIIHYTSSTINKYFVFFILRVYILIKF